MTPRPRPARLLLLSSLTALVFLHGLPRAAARAWGANELPSPQNDPGGVCGRKVRSSVCDPDGYLSQSDADEIQGLANFINDGSHGFKKLPCRGGTSGPQIAVAIVSSMRSGAGDNKHRAFQYARDLHDRWGVGDATCQNGVVLFFAVKDRAMGFSTGAGIKSVFTDDMVPAVMSDISSLLRDEEYGKAIVRAVTDIGNVLSGGKPPKTESDWDIGGAIFGIGIGAAVIGSTFAGSRSRRRYARCRDVLRRIDGERQRASANEYVCTSCPICLEDFDDASLHQPSQTGANNNKNNKNNTRSAVLSMTSTGAAAGPTARAAVSRAAADKADAKRDAAEAADAETRPLATESGAATRPAETTESDSRRTTTLLCGHRFHEECISTWLAGPRSNSNTCPICRQPVRAAADATQVEQRTNDGRPSGWDVYDPEYRFRVERAHSFYPDFITWSMIDSWQRDRYLRDRPMASSAVFTAVDPVVVAQAARSSGGGGSSFSFGGGSSAGGGGGGGGW